MFFEKNLYGIFFAKKSYFLVYDVLLCNNFLKLMTNEIDDKIFLKIWKKIYTDKAHYTRASQ